MNKQELLDVMAKHRACADATEYVRNHPSDDAAVIGSECDDVEWLIWLMSRERRLVRFVRVCAKRCEGTPYGTPYAAAYADHYAAASYAAAHAGYYVSYAADAAKDATYDAERAAQLKGLRRIFRNWANGLPAEV